MKCSHVVFWIITFFAWIMFASGLVAEHMFALYPCSMCLYQRYIHFGIGVLGFMLHRIQSHVSLVVMSLAFLCSGCVALYHVGIEYKYFAPPKSCVTPIKGETIEELRTKLMDRPVVRCDVPAWTMLGISMAGWNVMASFALAGLGFGNYLIRKRKNERSSLKHCN